MAKRKRGNGEGSIFQMKDGRWRAAISLGWKQCANGKKVWKKRVITKPTRHEVAEEMKRLLGKQQAGHNIDPTKQTLGEYLAYWLENIVESSVRPKTYRSYEQMVRVHLVKNTPAIDWEAKGFDSVPGLGNVRLSKLNVQDVQRFLKQKEKAGNSPGLVRYLRVVLRIALNHAIKETLIERNFAALATPPKMQKRAINPFKPEQAIQFLKAAQGHRFEALFTTALAVGLRSGECGGLRWPDVDLDAGAIEVRHTLQRLKGKGLVLMPPKSEESRRTIELPAICILALHAHRLRQQQEKLLAGSRWIDTDHVFTSKIGTPTEDGKILKAFNAIVETAQLSKQRVHDLRHACVSLLFAQGVQDKVIAKIVGHSDVRLTKNVYQHVYRDAKRAAATKMDALLTAPKAVENPVGTSVGIKPVSKLLN